MLNFGFIGLNDITEVLCLNLMKRTSIMAFAYDNSIARVEYLSERGAVACEMPADVVDRSDIILLSHKNYVDSQATIYSILGSLNSQKIILDLSAIAPKEVIETAEIFKPTGAEYADLAILNSMDDIENSKATILYGGPSTVFLRLQEYLKLMSHDVIKVGELAAAAAMKACYGLLYAQIQNGVNEMLLLASKSGLYVDDVIRAIQTSPAQNAFIDENGKKIIKGDYSVKTKIKNIHRELAIAHEFTMNNNIPMKGLQHTKNIYDSAMDRRLDNKDVTEIYTIVERASHS